MFQNGTYAKNAQVQYVQKIEHTEFVKKIYKLEEI